jgi:conjugal transfer mating pair stabilization protein TraN
MDTGIDKCVVDPTCAPGAGLYDAAQDVCVSYEKRCPLNTADKTYACVDVGGVEKCSINTCFDPNSPLPPDSTNNLTDDGQVDPNTGQCLGQIYIFNGQSQRCLRPGQRALTADCCSMPIPEDIYNEVSNPYNRFQRTVVDPLNLMSTGTLQLLTDYLGIFQGGCDMNEMLLNIAMKDKRTHYVGEWCLVKWLNWCVQKAQMHCIFNSTLARIINEQGRPQMKRFGADGGWGTPEQPDCSGFTFDEFQMLDFSRIDLSEFVDLVQARVVENMQDTIGDTVSDFYDQTLPSFNPQ